jgi:GNAT superfamily N-acetyltransferase
VYVTYLAVQEARRGQGIGSLLMSAVEEWARSKAAALILTDTNLHGPAVRFYAKNGFAQQSVILRKQLL